MALTKSSAVVQDWTAVAQNAVGESAEADCSASYSTTLGIQTALTAATAHTGTQFIVQVSMNAAGDADWMTLLTFPGPIGTANTEPITNDPLAQGSTTATCADTTGLYDDDGSRQIYIKDGTIANSELVQLVSHSANTSVTFQDGTENAHAQTTPMWDIAASYAITIPFAVSRARVLVDNTYDSDGASCDYRVTLDKVTALT